MSQVRMLTTTDNPYNPFDHWDEWFAFDEQAGYHTCSYLARVTRTSTELSQADQDQALDDAIDEILEMNLTGNYTIVTENDANSDSKT